MRYVTTAVSAQKNRAVLIRINNWRVTDGVRTSCNSSLNLPKSNLVGDMNGSFNTGPASPLHVYPWRADRKAGVDDALARQVPVAGVFDDGTQCDVTQRLPFEIIFSNQTTKNLAHHVLIGAICVDRMRTAKWNSYAANDGDPGRKSIIQHSDLQFSQELLQLASEVAGPDFTRKPHQFVSAVRLSSMIQCRTCH